MTTLSNDVTNMKLIEKVNKCAGIPDYNNTIDLQEVSNNYIKTGQSFTYTPTQAGIFMCKWYRKYAGNSLGITVNDIYIRI